MPSQSVDPRTGEAFGPVIEDTSEDQLEAVLAAAAAAAAAWGSTPGDVRAAHLRTVADELDAEAEPLAELADRETGLGLARLTGEVARTTFQLRAFADLAEQGRPVLHDPAVEGAPPVGHPELTLVRVPLGPVAVYGASNFPFAFSVPGGDTASALAAGCPVVVKAHPAHPQTSRRCGELVAGALAAAGAPTGVFAVVHGFAAGRRLVIDPRTKAAAFTGSAAGGRALYDLAVSRPDPIPFYGELGSVNPVLATPGGAEDATALVVGWLGSLTLGGGQFCTNPGLLLAPRGSGVRDEVARQVGQQPSTVLLHGGIAEHLTRSVETVMGLPGAALVAAGEPAAGAGAVQQVSVVEVPVASALADVERLATECFGPVGVLVEYDEPDQALELLRRLPGCLAAVVQARADEPLAQHAVEAAARIAGRVVWNEWPTGVAVTAGQHHGGPWPATTNPLHTSVGAAAMDRFLRPVAFQSVPAALIPH